ncbi:MAG: GAF domain-containing protein, partial [Gemmatimonadota bacterium]
TTREPEILNTVAEGLAQGGPAPGTDQSKSSVGVPIIGNRVLGRLTVENHEREHAFGPSEVRMLQTIATSMGVALQSARLFDETQRLLKETEQRNAELAVINSIQKGIAGSLDFQGIVDLVGDKLRQVLKSEDVGIAWFEPSTGLLHRMYAIEHGRRLNIAPRRPSPGGPWMKMVESRMPVVLNSWAEMDAAGMPTVPGTDRARSLLRVPVIVGDRVLGFIDTEDHERDNAYGESEIRLMQTIASSMGVALENARLFDETQRRTREAAALAEVGRDISSTLDVTRVMDRIAHHAKELLSGESSAIFLPDADSRSYRAIVAIGDIAEELKATEIVVGEGIIGSLVASGKAEYINDTAHDPRAIQIAGTEKIEIDERLIVAPLTSGSSVEGVMAVWRTGGTPFGDSDLQFLVGLSLQATVAIQNARLFAAAERRAAELATVNTVSRKLGEELDVDALVQLVGEEICSVFKADIAYVALLDRATGTINFPYQHGDTLQPLKRGQGLTGKIIDSGQPLMLNADVDRRRESLGGERIGKVAQSYLGVPIRVGGDSVGVLSVQSTRREGVYQDSDRRLLETIAANVGAALQNALLFDETKEALEQQKASADILRVISGSVSDTQPVFDKILDSCKLLFGGDELDVLLVDEHDRLYVAAYVGKARETIAATFPAPVAGSAPGRAITERRVVQYADVLHAPDIPPVMRRMGKLVGYHSVAFAPMLWEERGIGVVGVARSRGAFSDKELALLQTFADQAVIAIQNARLFNETKEALAHQTAAAEVLQVISSSVSDTTPVFAKILASCQHLFEGKQVGLNLVDSDGLIRIGAYQGPQREAFERIFPLQPDRTSGSGRAILERRVLSFADVTVDEDVPASTRAGCRIIGLRAVIFCPLLWEGRGIGAIFVGREAPGQFGDKDIALLKTFADQAVIAIQNARLFNETKEALERQTATAEILRVISGSITDTQPVFDAIVQSCQRLFGGKAVGLVMPKGEMVESVAFASDGIAAGDGGFLKPWPLDRGSGAGACILESRVIAVADTTAAAKQFSRMPQLAVALGYHSALFVPLLREGKAIGCLAILRAATGDFDAKEVSLAQTFADQAVIAIENARLFNETKEALERQTATAEVLRVISASPADVQPVLEAVADRSAALCEGAWSTVWLADGDKLVAKAASAGATGRPIDLPQTQPVPISRSVTSGRAFLERHFVHVEDIVPLLDTEYPETRDNQNRFGFRTILSVPMLKEGRSIGVIGLYRDRVKPFTSAEIALVQTFADQSVIAIENVRLFNETQSALQRQTASADILRVISQSPTDVTPVFQAIAERARLLCRADWGATTRVEGGQVHLNGASGLSDEAESAMRALFPMAVEAAPQNIRRALIERCAIQIPDVLLDSDYPNPGSTQRIGFRSVMSVPLLRDGQALGTIGVGRREPGEFPKGSVELLQTFADQAVIAIENVRLFNETKEALERQRASAEVLTAISSSISDARPVFEVILQSCQRLFAGDTVGLTLLRDDGMLDVGAYRGPGAEEMARRFPRPLARDSASGLAILDRHVLSYADVEVDDMPDVARESCRAMGLRSVVFAPMMYEERGIGVLWVGRTFAGAFADTQIALLKTFADQAVIAIQNARLFSETTEALEQQRTSAEVLNVISNSVSDTAPVFDAIGKACQKLFGSDQVVISLVRDDGQVEHASMATSPGWSPEVVERAWAMLNRGFPRPLAKAYQSYPIRKRHVVHYPDMVNGPAVPEAMRQMGRDVGNFSMLIAPMLWEGKGIGTVHVVRQPPRPFSEKEHALLATFADQAVIAIQNSRLFNETKDALEQQRASAEILAAISNSIADTAPVFETILERCEQLFAGKLVQINLISEDGHVDLAAYHGPNRDKIQPMFPMPLDDSSATGMAILRREVLHFPDIDADDSVPDRARKGWNALGLKAAITAPMLWEGRGIGAIHV